MHLGAGEIAVILILALLLFGAKRLPQVGKAAGEAIREFKAAFYGKPKGVEDAAAGEAGAENGAPKA
ncbi:MAG: twin-arginine translocase TatA/TatE family subunit [Treponema sp.]|jgi:sec-independent protein translocase protein TatA|nr:twin-arginine translocase TatA/TatE family subunit [Treponema sp.]